MLSFHTRLIIDYAANVLISYFSTSSEDNFSFEISTFYLKLDIFVGMRRRVRRNRGKVHTKLLLLQHFFSYKYDEIYKICSWFDLVSWHDLRMKRNKILNMKILLNRVTRKPLFFKKKKFKLKKENFSNKCMNILYR